MTVTELVNSTFQKKCSIFVEANGFGLQFSNENRIYLTITNLKL